MSDVPPPAGAHARYDELRGRCAVVTGAASGIGRGVAQRLAVEGMRLVVADMNADALRECVSELTGLGADAAAHCGDLSRDDDIDAVFDTALAEFGTVDLLVNNAADLRRQHALDEHLDLLDRQLATNIRSPYRCAQRAAATMRDGTGGSIVFISSVGAQRAHHRGLPYDATKGAIDAMTRAMAIELGPYGIRVNAIAPGLTETYRWHASGNARRPASLAAQVPLQRAGQVGDIAAMVAFLASAESSYVTGQVICVDGGITAQLSPAGPDTL